MATNSLGLAEFLRRIGVKLDAGAPLALPMAEVLQPVVMVGDVGDQCGIPRARAGFGGATATQMATSVGLGASIIIENTAPGGMILDDLCIKAQGIFSFRLRPGTVAPAGFVTQMATDGTSGPTLGQRIMQGNVTVPIVGGVGPGGTWPNILAPTTAGATLVNPQHPLPIPPGFSAQLTFEGLTNTGFAFWARWREIGQNPNSEALTFYNTAP